MSWFTNLLKQLAGEAPELPSPRDIIPRADIIYDPSTETLTIKNIKPKVWLTTVADTNNMDPTVDAGHTCLLTTNFKPEDLKVGDVVIYWNGRQNILHRIIKISQDSKGRRYRLKGDNCFYTDPKVVRDSDIKYLLLAVIY